MYEYVKNFVTACLTCQQTKCDTHPPKAPLIPMMIPEAPMEFVSIDIAYMPTDSDGYQYILLTGDIFSKYIDAIPLRDQTAPSIIRAFKKEWIFTHGNPLYLLSDQGSNVDGETMRQFCETLGIKKRRSSPFHSQGNGFAERNIRSVREILRSTLLDKRLPETKWRKLLPSLVFALNCSISRATKCVPYSVVFGRSPTLPVDLLFGSGNSVGNKDSITPEQYVEEIGITLKELWDGVTTHLKISKQEMLSHYNKKLQFNNFQQGEKVWLKIDVIKSGENKLAPKLSGPWTVLQKMPNGVTFEIKNEKSGITKIVHHDKLKSVKMGITDHDVPSLNGDENEIIHNDTDSDSCSSSSKHSDYSPSEASSTDSELGDDDNRRYPARQRRQRVIPGAVPWSSVTL